MATEAPRSLYSPDHIRNQMSPVLPLVNSLLEEVLCRGVVLFARYSGGPEVRDDNEGVVLLSYFHLLELFDGLKIQMAECSPATAALQLRAMFESLLNIEYILKEEAKISERASAYLYEVERQRKKFYLECKDPNTVVGEWFRRAGKYTMAELEDRLRDIENVLAQPVFKEVAKAYRKAKTERRYPNWYTLYGGPESIAKLAYHLGRGDWYAQVYMELSARIHGTDVLDRFLSHSDSGKPMVRNLRDVSEFNSWIDHSISMVLAAMRAMIRHFRPADETEQAAWFTSEISERWNSVPNIQANYG